ncbi:MAG TPA: right-handed parallel beta-helix repeat-containing protein [Streptosporangiaceae bacterium]
MSSHRTRTGYFAAALAALALAACSSGTSAVPLQTKAPGSATTPEASQSAGQAPGASSGSCGSGTQVSTASDLQSALANARPGETLVLAPGVYQGDFQATVSGTAAAPITLCGPRGAVLQGDSINSGYTFHLDHASYWRVEGFTVQGGQKGVMTDAASHVLISGLYVHGTGDEAIHLRDFSSYDTVSHNLVRDTGLLKAFFGEGIYVGTAHKNWCKYSGCQPDASDHDVITGNDVSNTTAENIDIKEGTTGGTISGNHLDGTGMDSSAATSWVNVKGNGWTVTGNSGVNSIGNGFSVHQVYSGWGLGNVFRGNQITVNGPGYGIYVQSQDLNTLVACDNTVAGAQSGFSTITCSRA